MLQPNFRRVLFGGSDLVLRKRVRFGAEEALQRFEVQGSGAQPWVVVTGCSQGLGGGRPLGIVLKRYGPLAVGGR